MSKFEITVNIPSLDRIADAIEKQIGLSGSAPAPTKTTTQEEAAPPKEDKKSSDEMAPTKKQMEVVVALAKELVSLTDTKTLQAVNADLGIEKVTGIETRGKLKECKEALEAAIAKAKEESEDDGI